MTHPKPLAAAALLGLALVAPPLRAQAPATLSGAVSYEKIPVGRTGLKLDAPERQAAAGIRVEVLPAEGGEPLAGGYTGADGTYRLEVPLARPARVRVRAVAATENARVVSASERGVYALTSPELRLEPGRSAAHDFLATDAGRVSGPFNIAHVIARANAVIRSAQPAVAIPAVEVRWDTAYADGTFFRFSEKVAYINGRRGEDSDEFDDHVIVHEYGHFIMASFSREDSPGGDHGPGELLDPRLAWSEGWADFFSAVVTGDPVYLDSGVEEGRQTVLVETDLEQNVAEGDRPGIWSEQSVGSALWDLYDAAAEPGDSVALGFGPLWAAFSGGLRKEPEPYLLTFFDALARGGVPSRELRQVLAARRISYPEVGDRFAGALRPGIEVEGEVDSRTTRRSNLLRSSAHYSFVVAQPRQVTLTMKITAARNPGRADLDLFLFDGKGKLVARSDATNGVGDGEHIVQRLTPGYYRAEVRSWSGGADSRLGDGNAHQGRYRLIVQY